MIACEDTLCVLSTCVCVCVCMVIQTQRTDVCMNVCACQLCICSVCMCVVYKCSDQYTTLRMCNSAHV